MKIATLTTAQTDVELAQAQQHEWNVCAADCIVFINDYCHIFDKVSEQWIPFRLWRAQAETLDLFQAHNRVIVLKARQIGMTWLALGYALWKMLFHPEQMVLLFSRRDDEAIELLSFRLKGMYKRLPSWMQARAVVNDGAHNWGLSNGSRAKAFPTGVGDSYAGTLAICDEFDLVSNQGLLLGAVDPAVGPEGQLILLSRVDKRQPQSRFKAIYKAARAGKNEWVPCFLPWYVHPNRTAEWYETRRSAIFEETGSLDDLFEQYPETDVQALAARSLDKRIPSQWLEQCYQERKPLFVVGESEHIPDGVPAIDGLKIWQMPIEDRRYVMGADPAEGLISSDDSSLTVLDAITLEEVARLDGKSEPKHVFPDEITLICLFYNGAAVLIERNNHGHAVIGAVERDNRIQVLAGHDGRPGWNDSVPGKVMLYDSGAAVFMRSETVVHDFGTMIQIGSIEKNTLRAPEGELDDKSDSYFLALKGAEMKPRRGMMKAKMTGLPGRG